MIVRQNQPRATSGVVRFLIAAGVIIAVTASGTEAAPPPGYPMRIRGQSTIDGYTSIPTVLEWDDAAGGYFDPMSYGTLVENPPGSGVFESGGVWVADWSVNRFSPVYNSPWTFFPSEFDYGIGDDNYQVTWDYFLGGFATGIVFWVLAFVAREILPAMRPIAKL